MRIKLYMDEDSARVSLIRALRARGADVVAPRDVTMLARPDLDQLEWAVEHQRVLCLFNRRDLYRLHMEWLSQGRTHWGIILSRQDLHVGEQMRRLLRIIHTLSAEEMQNRVEFLGAWVGIDRVVLHVPSN